MKYNVPSGGATVASGQRGVSRNHYAVVPKTTMQHKLAYVVGNDPTTTLAQAGFPGEPTKNGQRPGWSSLARRSKRYLSAPSCLVLRDGILVSDDEVGEDVVREIYGALDESERITVVALHI